MQEDNSVSNINVSTTVYFNWPVATTDEWLYEGYIEYFTSNWTFPCWTEFGPFGVYADQDGASDISGILLRDIRMECSLLDGIFCPYVTDVCISVRIMRNAYITGEANYFASHFECVPINCVGKITLSTKCVVKGGWTVILGLYTSQLLFVILSNRYFLICKIVGINELTK